MNTNKVVCFGELLIDMISQNTGSLVEATGFEKKFGGAPANTAVGIAKLGSDVSFIGKVGNDPFGKYLRSTLDSYNVDTSDLIMSTKGKTTLAFVSLTNEGDRDFYFYSGVHDTVSENEVSLINNCDIFHFGSLTQVNNTCRRATEKLVQQAQSNKSIISYDPNIRLSLWHEPDQAKKIILNTIQKVHILKVSEEEALFLTDTFSIDKASDRLFLDNLEALFITLGNKGCYYRTPSYEGLVSGIQVDVIDTTGAGDAFNAGYISELSKQGKYFSDLSDKEIKQILTKANMIAGLSTRKKGAISAFPSEKELNDYISSQ